MKDFIKLRNAFDSDCCMSKMITKLKSFGANRIKLDRKTSCSF